jgi:hypothetical protein
LRLRRANETKDIANLPDFNRMTQTCLRIEKDSFEKSTTEVRREVVGQDGC